MATPIANLMECLARYQLRWTASVAPFDFVLEIYASLRRIYCHGGGLFAQKLLLYHRRNALFRTAERWNPVCTLNGVERSPVAKTFQEDKHHDYSSRRGRRSAKFSKGIGRRSAVKAA